MSFASEIRRWADELPGPGGFAAGPDGVPSAPIDRKHLARYTLGDPGLEREILGLFIAQLPLTVEQLRFAATERDWHVYAHTLKGSAQAVGAFRVGKLALVAEKMGGRVSGPDREAILAEIDEAVAEVEAYLTDAFPKAA